MERRVPTALLMFLGHRAAEDEVMAAIAAAGFGDVTRAQGRLLAGLDEGGTRLVVLAERARITKQTALALVNALEAAGYVERVPDPTDGRARLVRLTAYGEGVLPAAWAAEDRLEAAWTAHLGERGMARLRAELEALRPLVDPAG